MEQKTIAMILKIYSLGVAGIGALFFLWYLPGLIQEMAVMEPEAAWLRWPGTVGVWAIGLLCYFALWEFWRICTQIGRDNSFCKANARSMKRIGILAFLCGALILGGFLFLLGIHYLSGPLVLATFFGLCVAGGIGVLCLALSGLIRNAAKLKEENELTI